MPPFSLQQVFFLMPQAGKLILAGQFGAAVGLKGEVRLQSFTAEPEAIGDYRSLSFADGTAIKIVALRPQGKVLVARVKDISSREAAEKLTGREVFIERAEFPEPDDDDEFYLADLVGLEVRDGGGVKTGMVLAVHDFGAGDILEIRPLVGPAFMTAFTRVAVPRIDLAQGYLVHLPLPEVSERDGEAQK